MCEFSILLFDPPMANGLPPPTNPLDPPPVLKYEQSQEPASLTFKRWAEPLQPAHPHKQGTF